MRKDANGWKPHCDRALTTAAEADHHGGVPTALLVLPTTAYRVSDYLDAAAALGVEVAVVVQVQEHMHYNCRLVGRRWGV